LKVWWFVDRAGERHGPIDQAECGRLINSGHITPETFIWTEGWPDWKPARLAFAFPPRRDPPSRPQGPRDQSRAAKPQTDPISQPPSARWAQLRRYATWKRVGAAVVGIFAILQAPTVIAELGGTACGWGVPFASWVYDCDGYVERDSGSLAAAYDGQLQDLNVAVMDGDKAKIDRLRRKGLKLRKDDFCSLFNMHYLDYLLGQRLDVMRDTVSSVTSPDRVVALLPFANGMPDCSSNTVTLVGEGGETPFDRLALDIAATRSLMEGLCEAKLDVMNERWSRGVTIINAIHALIKPSPAFRAGVKDYADGLAELRAATPDDRAQTCFVSQTSGGATPLTFTRQISSLCKNGATSTSSMLAAEFGAYDTEDDVQRRCAGIANKMSAPTPQVDQALSAWADGN
jgi:hypothetical protein